MPEKYYMSHIYENCFGNHSCQQSIKEGLGEALGNRDDAVKQYKFSEQKWKKDMKDLKKKKKVLYSISKKSGSRRELKKIKKIKAKASKKIIDYNSNSSRYELDSGSYLSINSDLDE